MTMRTQFCVHRTEGSDMKHFSAEVDSVDELINAPILSQYFSMSSKHGNGMHWWDRKINSALNAAQVMELLKNVDPLFYENLKPKLDKLTPPLYEQSLFRQHKRKRRRIKADHGNSVDIHAVMQGRLDRAWDGQKFEERVLHANKNVHLVINCSLNSSVEAKDAEWRSAATIAIYNELTRQGKSVAVYMVRTSSNMFKEFNGICTLMAPIKRLGERMSMEHMAAWTSATFTRSAMMYKYSNSIPGVSPTYGYGFAQNWEVYPHSLAKLADAGQAVVYVPHCFSEYAAKAAIERVVTQIIGESHRDQRTKERQAKAGTRRIVR